MSDRALMESVLREHDGERRAGERFRADLQEARPAVETGGREVDRRPPGARRDIDVDDRVERTGQHASLAHCWVGAGC